MNLKLGDWITWAAGPSHYHNIPGCIIRVAENEHMIRWMYPEGITESWHTLPLTGKVTVLTSTKLLDVVFGD